MAEIVSEGTSKVILVEDTGREITIIDTSDQRQNISGSSYRGMTEDGNITHTKIDMLGNRFGTWLNSGAGSDESMYRLVTEGLITRDMRHAGLSKKIAVIDSTSNLTDQVIDLISNFGTEQKVIKIPSSDYYIYRSKAFDIVLINATPGHEVEELREASYLVREEGRIIVLGHGEMSEKVYELYIDDEYIGAGEDSDGDLEVKYEVYHINNKLSIYHINPTVIMTDILMPRSLFEEIDDIMNDTKELTDEDKDKIYSIIRRINELIKRSTQEGDYKSKQELLLVKESLQNKLIM